MAWSKELHLIGSSTCFFHAVLSLDKYLTIYFVNQIVIPEYFNKIN